MTVAPLPTGAAPGLLGRLRALARPANADAGRRNTLRLGMLAVAAAACAAYAVHAGIGTTDAEETAVAAPIPAHLATRPAAASAAHPGARGGVPAGGVPAAGVPAAGAAAPGAAAERAAPDTVVIEREVYGYAAAGRRDPFRPLIVTAVLRPFASELRLVGVAYDPTGTNSVAILRDLTTKAQHRARVGQLVGRMRVVRIQPQAVVFAVEELGFSRRETLTLHDSLGTRQP